MKQCPRCKKWTLNFDDYFGRFRCSDPDCHWILTSSTERAIRLLEAHQEPEELYNEDIEEIGLSVKVTYDAENDALVFTLGSEEPAFDLPEPDGRFVWRISHQTARVTGFVILKAWKWGVSEIKIDIAARAARIVDIEEKIKLMPSLLAPRRATRFLIEAISVSTESRTSPLTKPDMRIGEIFKEGIRKFEEAYPQA